MTFNAGLFIATILGLTSGYFVFGFIRKRGFTKIYSPETDKCCTQIDWLLNIEKLKKYY